MIRLFLLVSGFTGAMQAFAGTPEWTVAIYAGIDEEEIAQASDPSMQALASAQLPSSIQLLIEKDGWGPSPVTRTAKEGAAPSKVTELPEHDSADPASLRNFLAWVKATARGKHTLLIIAAHSWGWKGIIQDYTIPNQPEKDTMMPLRDFGAAFGEVGFHPDIVVMDACVLGNADAIHEFRDIARYLVVSQRETPYQGLPYPEIFGLLTREGITAREAARMIPELYVRAYSRGGSLAEAEGEFETVLYTALDLFQWKEFTTRFAALTSELKRAGFRDLLSRAPSWGEAITDIDSNADVVELLRRLPSFVPDREVIRSAHELDQWLGYPDATEHPQAETIRIDPKRGSEFLLRIQRDPYVPDAKAKERFLEHWEETNEDLDLPDALQIKLEPEWVQVRGLTGRAVFSLRPWLPGVKTIHIDYKTASGWQRETMTHDRDYVSVKDFPAESLFVAEAHTQGAPLIHGIGVLLHPLMKTDEERGEDPVTHLAGPDAYRALGWNRETGWGDLILFQK